jgi:hypothetical protein
VQTRALSQTDTMKRQLQINSFFCSTYPCSFLALGRFVPRA